MLLLSKLVSLFGATIFSGSIVSFLIPYFNSNLRNQLLTSLIYKKDSSHKTFDFKILYEEATKIIKTLKEKIENFSYAESATYRWKHMTYQNILKIFDSLAKAETQLNSLYQKIIQQLKELGTKNEKYFEKSKEKLETEKDRKWNNMVHKAYSQLNNYLTNWESSMKDIQCAINQNCNKTIDALSTIFNSLFPFFPSSESAGGDIESGSVASGGEGSAGAQAKKELQKVSTELAKLISQIGKSNNDFKSKQAQALVQEQILSAKFLYLDSWLKFLKMQTEKLESELKSNSESSNELIEVINSSQAVLSSQYENYTKLKKQEASLHYWNAKLKEHLLKNESDLAREVKLDL